MNGLSVCMIVKNEEKSLPQCLRSIAGLWEELVIVDTGSTDKTMQIAAEFGARVIVDPWRNDFSYSRNISLQSAGKPWIFWLDADDVVPPAAALKIQKIKNDYPVNTAFGFQIQNSVDGSGGQVFQQVRMFPNRSDVRFEFRVHEQVLPSIQRAGVKVSYTDIIIVHTGYHPGSKQAKQERNLALLQEELRTQDPKNPVTVFMVAGALVDLGRGGESKSFYEQAYSLAMQQRAEGHIRDEVPLILAGIALEKGDAAGYDRWISVAKEHTPDHIKLNFIEGRKAERQNDPNKARDAFEKVILAEEKPSFIPIDYRMLKIQACASLGKLYGLVFKDKAKMIEILELAQKLAGK